MEQFSTFLQGFEKRELAEFLPAPKVSPEQVGGTRRFSPALFIFWMRESIELFRFDVPCFTGPRLCLVGLVGRQWRMLSTGSAKESWFLEYPEGEQNSKPETLWIFFFALGNTWDS